VPLLRKEFIVDEYQIWEARALGADAILLIVAALADAEIVYFQDLAAELGMAALVEVHDAAELDRAMACGARIVGVNNRNLKTLAVDLATTEALAPSIPRDVVKVGESGIRSISDVGRMVAAGIDAILVGEALVVADDPGALIRAWRHLPAHAEVR
jgi:indole-3-glycerol phosphate synthase